MQLGYLLIVALFLSLSFDATAENYIGITQQSEYVEEEVNLAVAQQKTGAAVKPILKSSASGQKDAAYDNKIDKIDAWTKNAYRVLNDGSQEKWTEGLEQVYRRQVEEIKAGGLGYAPEYEKYKEKKLAKPD